MNDDELRSLVVAIERRGESCRDRLSIRATHEPPTSIEGRAWLGTWATALGGPDALERRLRWLGHDLETAGRRLSRSKSDGEAPRSPWAIALLQLLSHREDAEAVLSVELAAGLRHGEFLAPFVASASRQWKQQVGDALGLLTPQAQQGLLRDLFNELEARTTLAFAHEFGPAGLSREAISRVLLRHSALAKVLSNTVLRWVSAKGEFVRRLANDLHLLREAFGPAIEPCVNAVTTDRSDPHLGMRTVAIVEFCSGVRVVYKPRTLAVEERWNTFLDRCAQLGVPFPLSTLKVLDRGEYGWAEFACAATETDNISPLFYARAGALLCFVHLLGGTDAHAENVLRTSDSPLLVDVETLLTHTVRGERKVTARERARGELSRSVLATHLLPRWTTDEVGSHHDVSGFGQFLRSESQVNAEDELVRGFSETYAFLSDARNRPSIVTAIGPFSGIEIRSFVRGTSVYRAILARLDQPQFSSSGIARSIYIDRLALGPLHNATAPRSEQLVAICESECRSLEDGDVPYFWGTTDGVALLGPEGLVVDDWFENPSYNACHERIISLSKSDHDFQIDLVRASIRCLFSGGTSVPSPHVRQRGSELPIDLAAEAIRLAEQVVRAAIHGDDGALAWLQPLPLVTAGGEHSFQIDIAGVDLYDGSLGIALFLGGAYALSGEQWLRTSCLSAIKELLFDIRSGHQEIVSLGIGGLTGLGSLIYGLTHIGRLVSDDECVHAAQLLVKVLTTDLISNEHRSGIGDGVAGAMLGLLAVHSECGDADALEKALFCREVLGARGHSDFQGGMLHGSLGMAVALARLDDRTDATQTGRLPQRDAQADLHLRQTLGPSHEAGWASLGWCRGVAGRVAGLASLGGETSRERAVLAAALEQELCPLDHVCCGTFGILDCLHQLVPPGETELLERSRCIARRVAARASSRGEYLLSPSTSGKVVRCGLFRGLSGIGYTLLRLCSPGRFPNLLVLGGSDLCV